MTRNVSPPRSCECTSGTGPSKTRRNRERISGPTTRFDRSDRKSKTWIGISVAASVEHDTHGRADLGHRAGRLQPTRLRVDPKLDDRIAALIAHVDPRAGRI